MKTLNLESTGLWLGNDGVTYGPFKKIDNFPGKNITLFICLQTELIFNVLGNLVGAKDSQIHKLSENIKLIDNISSDDSDDDLDEVDETIEADTEYFLKRNIQRISDNKMLIKLIDVPKKITENMILHTKCNCSECQTNKLITSNGINTTLIDIIEESFDTLIASGMKSTDIFVSGELPDFKKYVVSFQNVIIGYFFGLLEDRDIDFKDNMKKYFETLVDDKILEVNSENILYDLGLVEVPEDIKLQNIAVNFSIIDKINKLIDYCYLKSNRRIIVKRNLTEFEDNHLIVIFDYLQQTVKLMEESKDLKYILLDFSFNAETDENFLIIDKDFNSELGAALHKFKVKKYNQTLEDLPKNIIDRIVQIDIDYEKFKIDNAIIEKQLKAEEKLAQLTHSQDFNKFVENIKNNKSGIFKINIELGTKFQIKLLIILIKEVLDKNPEYTHEFLEYPNEDYIGIKYTFKPLKDFN